MGIKQDVLRALRYVDITAEGAILLGKSFAVDSHEDRSVRVISHAHYDHLLKIEKSVLRSKFIVGTKVTLDLAVELGYISRDLLALYIKKLRPLEYYEVFEIDNEKLTLYPAEHIPGASQVLVEVDGLRLAYTGDFKFPGTPVIEEPDVLVIESTYGNPSHVRPFKDSVPRYLADLVAEGLLKYGRVNLYGYHGKLQEAMKILRDNGIDALFVLTEKVCRATKVLEKYGMNFGNYICNEGPLYTERAVFFKHFASARYRRLDGESLHIILSGWEFREPVRKIDDFSYVVALSDHADYSDLISYVKKSNPGLVVVDGYRDGDARGLRDGLAREGFCAIVLPSPTKEGIESCQEM